MDDPIGDAFAQWVETTNETVRYHRANEALTAALTTLFAAVKQAERVLEVDPDLAVELRGVFEGFRTTTHALEAASTYLNARLSVALERAGLPGLDIDTTTEGDSDDGVR